MTERLPKKLLFKIFQPVFRTKLDGSSKGRDAEDYPIFAFSAV
jgi:hypothetical protein